MVRPSFAFNITLLLLLLAAQHLPAQKVDSSWLTSLKEGQRIAAATGKPIFVVFRCVR